MCILFICLINLQCTQDKGHSLGSGKKGFQELDAKQTGLDFTNFVEETQSLNVNHFLYMYNGSGVAIGDLNNDGLDEIFLGGNDATSKLFLNEGNLQFKDITSSSKIVADKWVNGVSMVDINNDGWLDIYVCNAGPSRENADFKNQLFINNKDLSFTESAAQYGLDVESHSNQAFFADMDKDGDLDMYLLNHLDRGFEKDPVLFLKRLLEEFPESELAKVSNMYFENENGKFTNKSVEKGLANLAFGLGAAIADLNQDGWLDIYATNDFFLPDFYYINNKQGAFEHASDRLISHISYFAMGIDANDFNNDGHHDLAILDMTPEDHVRNKTVMRSMDVGLFNTLSETLKFPKQYMNNSFYLNAGDGYLMDVAHYLRVSQTDWSWAPLLFDIDNDGWKDYFVSNGYLRDFMDNDHGVAKADKEKILGRSLNEEEWYQHLQEMPSTPIKNMVFSNYEGKKLIDKTDDWGIQTPTFSNGAAYSDLDLDGDLDLVINNLNANASLLENINGSNAFTSVQLRNTQNPNAVYHAKVSVHIDSLIQYQDYTFTRGFNSSMGHRLHFGLAGADKIDSIVVNYLDGTIQTMVNPEVNKHLILDKSEAKTRKKDTKETDRILIDLTPRVGGFKFEHTEDTFNDFEEEILLPHKYSNLGPCLAIADVNGDGLEDFYLGGSAGYPGMIAYQRGSKFEAIPMPSFDKDAAYEDIGAHFFDFNKDGYPDLYVASGGGGDVSKPSFLQDRLYINQKDGTFRRSRNALPTIASSTSQIISDDFNGDGQMDLFVAGRNKPKKYPLAAQSYLLIQENGVFVDKTSTYFSESLPGMITGIAYEDVNGDQQKDLVFTAEWEAPSIFLRSDKGFKKQDNTGFDNVKGWWQSIAIHDFDKDGDKDLMFGNIGENNKFHPSNKKPLGIYAGDVDHNGSHDIVLTKHYKNMVVPVRGKECSTEQMPFLADKYKYYNDFASSSINEILGKENIEKVDSFSVNDFASYIAINQGNGLSYEMVKLPFEAQLAPIKAMVVLDFNADGYTDVFCAGNIQETEPETTSYDAGGGLMLLGKGDGNFTTSLNIDFAGARCNGNVTDMKTIRLGRSQTGIIVANNNSSAQILLPLKF